MSDDIPVRPVGTYDWVRTVSNIDFGGSDGVKGVAGRTIKGVAFRLSYWANPDGTQVIAGPARISVICEVDYKTAKTVLGVLRKHGLLTVVRRGRGPTSHGGIRVGDEYRLTVPLDLPERLLVRSEDQIKAAVEATKVANRRKDTGTARPRKSDDGLEGCYAPVTLPSGPEVTGAMVPRDDELRGNPESSYGGNGSAVPTHDLPLKNHQPISLSDYRPSVPAPRQAPTEDRERDGEPSSSRPEPHPETTAYDVLAAEGVDHDEATRLIPVIKEQCKVRTPAFWRHVAKNRDIVQIITDARAEFGQHAAAACDRCGSTGKVPGRSPFGDTPTEHDCPACTPLSSEAIGAFTRMLAGQPQCAHGYEGGNVPMPERGWMACAVCRAQSGYVSAEPSTRDQQPRTGERGGYRAAKVNSDASPGWATRPNGSKILVDSHHPGIDWYEPL